MKRFQERIDLVFDLFELMVGADFVFDLTPERVHRIEFRRALRQPKQADPKLASQALGLWIPVTGMPIQDQANRPATVSGAQVPQKETETLATISMPGQRQEFTRPDVDCTEDDTLFVPARDEHPARRASRHPILAQRRKQQKVGLILEQKSSFWR